MTDFEADKPPLEETIALIYKTFKGVTREGGISWSEAGVIDSYGTEEEMLEARLLDCDSSWEELIDDPDWYHCYCGGGFHFLDPIGYRYYLPAAMVLEIRYQDRFLRYHLTLSDKFRENHLEKWSALTEEEIQCVCEYLKCEDARNLWQDGGDRYFERSELTEWRKTYLSHWVNLDKNPVPEGAGRPY